MGLRELKNRGRSLLAWILVFSLITGVLVFGVPEVKARAATGDTLEVQYVENREVVGDSTIYPDDGSSTEVTVVFPETIPGSDSGNVLFAWALTTGNTTEYIKPGTSRKIAWSDIPLLYPSGGVTDAGTNYIMTLTAVAAPFSFEVGVGAGDDFQFTPENYSGTYSIVREETGFSIQPPVAEPQIERFQFSNWCLNGLEYDNSQNEFLDNNGAPLFFSYDSITSDSYFMMEAIYDLYVGFAYYNTIEEIDNGTPENIVYSDTAVSRDDPFEMTADVSKVTGPDGASFLAWYLSTYEGDSGPYSHTGTYSDLYAWNARTVQINDTLYPNVISIAATWLTPTFIGGYCDNDAVTMDDYTGKVTIEDNPEGGYTITAPTSTPTAEGYFFNGWASVEVAESAEARGIGYFVGTDGVVSTANVGVTEEVITYEPVIFSYGGDVTATFTASWERAASAEVTFNTGEQTGFTQTVYQTEAGQTEYSVTMPSETPVPSPAGYQFAGWQYVAEDGTKYVYQKDDVTTLKWSFDGEAPIFTALWKPSVIVVYFEDGSNSSSETTVTGEVGTTTVNISLPAGPTGVQESVFLAWNSNAFPTDTPYLKPGSNVTLDVTSLEVSDTDVVVMIYGSWLRVTVASEEVALSEEDKVVEVTGADTYFTIKTPPEPESMDYFFNGWDVLVGETESYTGVEGNTDLGKKFSYADYDDYSSV